MAGLRPRSTISFHHSQSHMTGPHRHETRESLSEILLTCEADIMGRPLPADSECPLRLTQRLQSLPNNQQSCHNRPATGLSTRGLLEEMMLSPTEKSTTIEANRWLGLYWNFEFCRLHGRHWSSLAFSLAPALLGLAQASARLVFDKMDHWQDGTRAALPSGSSCLPLAI